MHHFPSKRIIFMDMKTKLIIDSAYPIIQEILNESPGINVIPERFLLWTEKTVSTLFC